MNTQQTIKPRLFITLSILVLGFWFPGEPNAAEEILSRYLLNRDTGEIKIKAEEGDTMAQEVYAGRLERSHQYAEAAEYYRKAAVQGRTESQYRLGCLLLKGRSKMMGAKTALASNPTEAIQWLTRAAEQNHEDAQRYLGDCYLAGTGVRKDPVEAYKWFLLAAEKSIVARSYRDRLALTLSTDQIKEGKLRAQLFKSGGNALSLAGSIRLKGIMGTKEKPLALIENKSFEVDESGIIQVNGQPLIITCHAITPQSATISIKGISGKLTLGLAK